MTAGAVRRRSLPLGFWPESDRLGWLAAIELDNGLFLGRPRPKWRPVTVAAIQGSYGRWLAWLKDEHPAILMLGPAGRLTRETVALYVDQLRERLRDISIGTALVHIQTVTCLLAPGTPTAWLRPVVGRFRRRSVSARRKAERVVDSGDLLRFGVELMQPDKWPTTREGHEALLRYRDGLIIALLAMRPLRMGNFLSVRLGIHLTERHGVLWLCFPGEETKNGLDLEYPFPPGLLAHLRRYLDAVRPRLLAAGERDAGYLWVSRTGSPLGRQTLYAMLKRRTAKRFGKELGPHLFRDCLATSLAAHEPDLGWAVAHMLGHRTRESADRSYSHTGGAPEHMVFQRHLEGLRRRKRSH